MGAAAHGQIDLRFILQQNMAVLMENGIGEFAPVLLFPVFVVYIVVIDAEGEPGVIGDAVFLNGRGIGEDIAGPIGKQVELRDALPGLQRQNGTQIVPYGRILRIGNAGLTALHRIGCQHIGNADGVIAH